MARGRKKTHEEFIKEMNEINPNIEILGEYITSKTPIECRCKIDGYEWTPRPNDLLNSGGCPKCSRKASKTTKEFIQEMNEINPSIEIIGEYINVKTKIKCKCKIDGHEWSATPNHLLQGSSCPKCSGKMKLTHEEFMEKFYNQNPNAHNIEILGEYVNNKTKIKCKCKIDGHEWSATPNDLLNGSGCLKCSGKMQKTHEEFIKEMNEINPNIEILGEYVNSSTNIKCRCKIDGHEWTPKPHNLLSLGQGCPKCNSSKGEKAIAKHLKDNDMDFIEQHRFENCKHKITLPFDFYLPKLNIAIEYDGIQHFEVVEYFGGLDGFIDTKIRDTIKNIYCKDNNIKLIRIPYWEFENIEEILNKELSL